ncbi:hypothetical protein E4U43_007580 [Claviceps pusilla]|uniref:Uncharacterized protein n=1 Tax=Claviceps pusilla TaxID=123648 RepID=A0A9P7NE86_9HYPO|nr:hypothetical protein E4U43_007580 [Claviceps pusilla]
MSRIWRHLPQTWWRLVLIPRQGLCAQLNSTSGWWWIGRAPEKLSSSERNSQGTRFDPSSMQRFHGKPWHDYRGTLSQGPGQIELGYKKDNRSGAMKRDDFHYQRHSGKSAQYRNEALVASSRQTVLAAKVWPDKWTSGQGLVDVMTDLRVFRRHEARWRPANNNVKPPTDMYCAVQRAKGLFGTCERIAAKDCLFRLAWSTIAVRRGGPTLPTLTGK